MVSLRKAFENAKKAATKAAHAQSELASALGDSKYADIDLPDDVIDSTDYGQADMTYEEFIERMDEELENSKE